MKRIIEIQHFREGKRKLVAVPVTTVKSKFILYEDDWKDLIALGVSPLWHYYHKMAIVRSAGKEIPVARLIRDARPHQLVTSLDGNPFNLRKDNLILAPGYSRFRARDMIVRPFKQTHTIKDIYN